MTARLRIAVIAPLRFPISQPFAGGLESSLWHHVRSLRARGHDVVLCATEGSDFLDASPPELVLPAVRWNGHADATDTTYPPGYLSHALTALARAMERIATDPIGFDVIDNHCLHGVPLRWSGRLRAPMVTTLHTPPLPAMLAAHGSGIEPRSAFVAVSSHTAAEWAAAGVPARVVPNAVDTDRWAAGPGGDDLVWFGRLVPEKGAHFALAAARATGRRIVLAGRIGDARYFSDEIAPHLGREVEFAGLLDQRELAELVGSSACALVTPVWDEPFGLVIAEAMSTGTPVVSFASGGVPEVMGSSLGSVLVPAGDTAALARGVQTMTALTAADPGFRTAVRRDAVARFSLDRRARDIEAVYAELDRHSRAPRIAELTELTDRASA